jgi:ABC-type multidrug transport system fused ATPase/permease subunit
LSSGKSLLAAIMGQIKHTKGTVGLHGTCGYVPQEPWLINATIRDNIIFGNDYDEARYSEVVRICGLTRDLMLMSNGDESIISDLNLSASQRQRLSLARCLYNDADIILMEDNLSDFDQSIAKRLFKECFRNYLAKSKAVVFVTQQKQV